jgi:hypothetical protein
LAWQNVRDFSRRLIYIDINADRQITTLTPKITPLLLLAWGGRRGRAMISLKKSISLRKTPKLRPDHQNDSGSLCGSLAKRPNEHHPIMIDLVLLLARQAAHDAFQESTAPMPDSRD